MSFLQEALQKECVFFVSPTIPLLFTLKNSKALIKCQDFLLGLLNERTSKKKSNPPLRKREEEEEEEEVVCLIQQEQEHINSC